MAERGSAGEKDKVAAEKATERGANQDAADAAVRVEESQPPPESRADREAREAARAERAEERAAQAEEKAREKAPSAAALSQEVDTGTGFVVDPFPDYGSRDLAELRKLADKRGVVINRDVEKAELIKELRAADRKQSAPEDGAVPPNYDFMSLEDLRALAEDRDVHLSEDFERGHLVGELRAADTSVDGGLTVKTGRK